jgi:DNA-binding Xre family transcriptional regulator
MSIYEVREKVRPPRSHVKEIMEAQGVTLQALMDRTQLSKIVIQRARGDLIKKCKLETLYIIADGLGVDVKDLFD